MAHVKYSTLEIDVDDSRCQAKGLGPAISESCTGNFMKHSMTWTRTGLGAMAVALISLHPVLAQSKHRSVIPEADADYYIDRDHSQRVKFRVGLRIEAPAGALLRAVATTVNPIEWPEQQLVLEKDETPPSIQVQTRNLGGTAEQLLLRVPGLARGSSLTCARTYELTRWTQRIRPETKDQFRVPPADRVRTLLLPSDGIEAGHAEIRAFAAEVIRDKATAWDQVQGIFEATRTRVKYSQGLFAGALAGLRSGQGDCEERSCLFIACCRASGIPARLVWGPQHSWSEFALVDSEGRLLWIPADPTKEERLGVINHFIPILQKGDRFTLPEVPGKPQRYLAPRCSGTGATPTLASIEQIEPLE